MSELSDFYNYGRLQVYFPNQVSRKIRIADLIPESQSGSHGGIASYTYVGNLGDAIVDPGVGNCGITSEGDDFFGMQLVISVTDKNGMDVAWPIEMMFFEFGLLEYHNVFIYIHSKSDPKCYMGFYVFDIDAITDDDDDLVGIVFNVYPAMMSVTYDAETDEYTSVAIPNNDEVIMSWDFAFNPEYIGTMGTQDSDSVGISGGTISGTNLYSPPILELPVKEDTGDPAWPNIGRIYINSFDKLVRIYVADDDWRTLLDFS